MYYEEKIIDGVLHWRGGPNDDWTEYTIEELSRKVVRQQDELRAVREAPVAIMDKREFLSLCAPTEDDFPALYALQGRRVRLVPVGDDDGQG